MPAYFFCEQITKLFTKFYKYKWNNKTLKRIKFVKVPFSVVFKFAFVFQSISLIHSVSSAVKSQTKNFFSKVIWHSKAGK